MGVINTVLLVFFIIVAVLLVLLVLVQTEEGEGLGGIFAGGSNSAFGSRSGNVLTKTTTVLGASFMIISLGLALLSRGPGGTGVLDAGLEQAGEQQPGVWLGDELIPPDPAFPADIDTALPLEQETLPEAAE